MRLDLPAVFRAAWATFKRDREVLLVLAGLFLFTPQLAMLLLVATPPDLPSLSFDPAGIEQMRQWQDQVAAWASANGWMVILLVLLTLFGQLAILANYLGPTRHTVREALGDALRLLPRYILLSVITGLPVALGLQLLVLPGIFFQARLFLADAALVDGRPRNATGAFGRSFSLTRGHTLGLMGVVAAIFLAEIVLAAPFIALRQTLDAAPTHNPVSEAIVESIIAALLACGMLASLMLRVTVYRRLSPSNGI